MNTSAQIKVLEGMRGEVIRKMAAAVFGVPTMPRRVTELQGQLVALETAMRAVRRIESRAEACR